MTPSPFRRQHRLASRGEPGLVCDGDGLALGTIALVSVENGEGQARRYRASPASEIARILHLAYEGEAETTLARFGSGLGRVADLLEAGDVGRAGVQAVLLQLPPISPEGMAKLAAFGDVRKAGPADEPRLSPGQAGAGEWTDGGGGGGDPTRSDGTRMQPTADHPDLLKIKKATFVNNYIGYAQAAALKLGVPVENILGVSALESRWGESRFAIDKSYNNFFGMYAPAPRSHRSVAALLPAGPGKKPVQLAAYDTIQDSFMSFADKYIDLLKGKRDPVEFATVLQKQAKFGIDTNTGKPVQGYIEGVAADQGAEAIHWRS